jgi:hypothetical protein
MAGCYWTISYDHNTARNTRRFTTGNSRDRKTIAIASTRNAVVIVLKHAGHALQQFYARGIVFVGRVLAQYPKQLFWVRVSRGKICGIVQAFLDLFTHHFNRVRNVFVRYFHLHGLKVPKTRQFFPYRLKNPYPKQKKMARALVIT